MMAMMVLAAGLCSFEVAAAAEAGLGLGDLKEAAEATIQGTLERKAAIAREVIAKTLHGKATSTLSAATATPTPNIPNTPTPTISRTPTPTIPNTGTVLVGVNFATRITTFSVANFTTNFQQQYVDAIYQSLAPNVLQVLINSIIAGSVIVNTTAVIPQNQVNNFQSAANNSFGLPPATFGQPELSSLSVTLAPGNTTLPVPPSTLPIASATPSPQTPAPPTTPGAQSMVGPPTTGQPQTTTNAGTTAQPQTTAEASTAPPDTSTAIPTTNPPTTPPSTTPSETTAIVPTTTLLPTTSVLPTSTIPITTPPPTTPSDKCLRLPGPTACNANMCATPPNTGAYEFCGCAVLDQSVDIETVGGLTNLTYYTCLQNITGSLSLISDPDLATLNGLEDLTDIDGAFDIFSTTVLQNIGTSLPALHAVGDVSITANDGLTSINGFNALQTVGNTFISSNNNLATISGFNALKASGNIYIGGNPSLTSVQGFEALTIVRGLLQFDMNDGITTFDSASFAALERVEGPFDISTDFFGAAALTSISGFSALTTVDGPFTIKNNLALQSVTGFTALANITASDVANRKVAIECSDTGTPSSLVDISGLATLAQCGVLPDGDPASSSGDPYLNSIQLKIDVYPPGSNGCTLSTWDDVCGYIVYGDAILTCQAFNG